MTRLKLLSVLPILLLAMKPAPPKITTQPVSRTVTAPAPATFSVVASGSKLSYQWLQNGANITGATLASYTTPATTTAMSGAKYLVAVSNGGGTLQSSVVTLTVVAAPQKITINPTTTAPQATVGTAYSLNIASAANVQLNGVACTTCSYAVTSGTLPAWAALSTAGVLTGTPNATGTSSFTITVTAPSGAKKKIGMKTSATH
jgi:hypothetical protein